MNYNKYLNSKGLFSSLSEEAKKRLIEYDKGKKESKRPAWKEYYLAQAFLAATRSHDARTKHGAILTTQDNVFLAEGYNGFIGGIDDNILPNYEESKYTWIGHAEHSCILNCAKNGICTNNTIMYSTGQPCIHCIQIMWRAGVRKIIHGSRVSKMMQNEENAVNNEIFQFLIQNNLPLISVDFSEKDVAAILSNVYNI